MYNHFFNNEISKLKQKPLELVTHKNNISIIDENNNNIFKTTEILPTIKLGCKYDQGDNNHTNDEDKDEFLEKLKIVMNKIKKKKKKSRSRNIFTQNCYEVLDNMKKKKVNECERLIRETSEEVKLYKEKINSVYNNLKKTFEQNDEWNYYNYDSN